jgi:hypothetical protein
MRNIYELAGLEVLRNSVLKFFCEIEKRKTSDIFPPQLYLKSAKRNLNY